MKELEINTRQIDFAQHEGESGGSMSYKYSSGDWVEWSWQGSEVYGKVSDRTKDSFTVDGNKITGDDGEPVYKISEYDTEQEEMTGQDVAKPQSSLSKWGNAPDMAEESKVPSEIEKEVLALDFEMDRMKVVSMWEETTNMSEEQMEAWDQHPCADAGVDGGRRYPRHHAHAHGPVP
jgi:Protein of unknown function (DUF2945).